MTGKSKGLAAWLPENGNPMMGVDRKEIKLEDIRPNLDPESPSLYEFMIECTNEEAECIEEKILKRGRLRCKCGHINLLHFEEYSHCRITKCTCNYFMADSNERTEDE